LVSLAKSSIFFSPNTNALLRAEICEELHITTEAISDKYLGLPALVGADRSDCFEHFIERIIQRINGWKEKMLSIGGKEILLKAVAQAIPVYAMSVFLIPKGVCKRMMDAISKFWWGDDDNSNKMHWLAWWKLCYPKREGGMGFRDFHSFNLAMLAKQVWRLIEVPESLCARVLRAKYFPHGDILKAGPKAGSSFTWQSIVAGVSTFKRGYLWRVGDGERINIWLDPWIPSSPDRRVISVRGNTVLNKVSDLISPVTGQWDLGLLESLFCSVDVNRILQIPLNNRGFEDFIAWGFSSNGKYTVRSGYHLQWRHQFGPSAGQLSLPGSSVHNPVWKELWMLHIPSKIKIFVWRSLHGILPLKCILANRHIGTSGECPICHHGPEDISHLLFKCHTAQELWRSLGLHAIIEHAIQNERSGSVALEILLRAEPKGLHGFNSVMVKETIAITCWYLWWIRRQQTRGESVPPIFRCKMSILAIAANSSKETKKKRESSEITWVKPPPRTVKINVDASFMADSSQGVVGAVARDYQGSFIAAMCIFLPHVASVEMAEAFAMKEGLTLAARLGCNSIIAESDSLVTVEACSGKETWWTSPAAIYADCFDIASSLGSARFAHCPREANQVAHEIVKYCFLNKPLVIGTMSPLVFSLIGSSTM
jgi:ribonuclease HI